ncbi:hypothetical protein QJS10_CPA05g01919 [Acorus calamus]|uniref:Reverse transcriptase n=1 Tax=Acorus calamus TaxID=4465 RepID=A0AAV9ETU8_ACOCL|nr:hypothetical protein QJS10_CPA05g01919 [Acorus calamus]
MSRACIKVDLRKAFDSIRWPFLEEVLKSCKLNDQWIRKKLASWTVHSLSRAGRLELIKSVLSSFHIFWSSAFRIPRRTQKDIEKMLRDFLWQGSSPVQKAHHVNWDIICKPLEEGGLGIKVISEWTSGAAGVRLWT